MENQNKIKFISVAISGYFQKYLCLFQILTQTNTIVINRDRNEIVQRIITKPNDSWGQMPYQC